MTRSLVTGGNGFLGAPLARALARSGHEVTAFDRFSREPAVAFPDGVTLLRGDFLDRDDLEKAVAGQRYVFHFLSMSTPAAADADPFLDIQTNVLHSVELFKACVSAGVERVYFASSGGAAYGNQVKLMLSEDDPAEPISPYGIGKIAIENYLGYFRAKHGLDSISFRISNPYGQGQPPGRVQGLIPVVLERVAQGLPITRSGGGTMVRDYIYIDDVIDMTLAVVEGEPARRVYNIGSGVGHSVNEVIELITSVTGIAPTIDEVPKPATFVESIVLDTSRFAAEFGAPTLVPLEEGIHRTWAGFAS